MTCGDLEREEDLMGVKGEIKVLWEEEELRKDELG